MLSDGVLFFFIFILFFFFSFAAAVMLSFMDGINDNDHDLYGIFATLFMIGCLGPYMHTHEQTKNETKRILNRVHHGK